MAVPGPRWTLFLNWPDAVTAKERRDARLSPGTEKEIKASRTRILAALGAEATNIDEIIRWVTNRSKRFWWRSSNWHLPAASAAIMATVFATSRVLALQTEFQPPALTNHKFHTICGVLTVRTVHETRHRRIAGKGKDHQSLPW